VGDSYKIYDVVDAIMEELGIVGFDYSRRFHDIKKKLQAIAKHLKQLQTSGHFPVIIIDEAENLKPSVLKTIKELYDAVHDYASIVLIGTDQILDAILNRKQKNRQSVPQLWRRFKAGTRYISALDKVRDFKPFFDLYIPADRSLQELLIQLCENYGELHDYLDPVCRAASKKGEPVTEQMFRMKHKIPYMKRA
jgi:DNA transposition AAA+ family ATPase